MFGSGNPSGFKSKISGLRRPVEFVAWGGASLNDWRCVRWGEYCAPPRVQGKSLVSATGLFVPKFPKHAICMVRILPSSSQRSALENGFEDDAKDAFDGWIRSKSADAGDVFQASIANVVLYRVLGSDVSPAIATSTLVRKSLGSLGSRLPHKLQLQSLQWSTYR